MKFPAIICGSDLFEDLRNKLLSSAPNESAAILLCTSYLTFEGEQRLLVKDIVHLPAEAYLIQTGQKLTIDPIFLSRVFKRARLNAYSVIMTHTHPFSDWPEFSDVDDAGERDLIPVLQSRIPNKIHGALVLGRNGFSGRVYDQNDHDSSEVHTIILNGPYIQHLTKMDEEFVPEPMHDRNVRAFGSGQNILKKLKVGIVGLGGIGSIVAQELAHLGVGNLKLVDFDSLDITNLNRVVGAKLTDVGRLKVDIAKEFIESINHSIKVTTVKGSVLNESVTRQLLDCDFIFSCTDSHGSRAVLNQLAYQFLIPTIDTGVRIDAFESKIQAMAGRVQMLAVGLPCLVCGNLLDAEQVRRDFLTDQQRKADPYITGHSEPQPAIISINATVASLAVTMFLSATVRIPNAGRHLIYIISESTIRRIGGHSHENCVICSAEHALASGEDWLMAWKNESN